jgi:hypothetical protein
VANGTQYLPVYRSGFTGPSARIGGSSDYHIDLKILDSLPVQEKVRALDSLARQYQSLGRDIEFSNQGVSGRRWNLGATPQEKEALLQAAAGAHAPRGGWTALDFYVPFKGEDRFGKSVEGASIFLPGVPGGKIRRGSGGGYGFFSEAMDPSGRVVFRVGHGDINRPEEDQEIVVQDPGPTGTIQKTQAPANNDALTTAFLGTMLGNMLSNRRAPDMAEGMTPSESALAGMDSDKTSRKEEIQEVLQQALAEKTRAAKADRELEEQAYLYQQGQKAIGATKERMANLLASAQKAFSPGQPVF